MRNFKELEVWKEGRVLVKDVYLLTKSLPEEEKFGLTSQIKRCVIQSLQILQKVQQKILRKILHDFYKSA